MRELERNIVRRVRTLLKERDMTVVALSAKAEITQGYLTELMNLHPKKRWNADHIEQVAEALGVPAWQLLADPREVLPKEHTELMDNYRHLDAGRKQAVDDIFAAARVERKKKPQAEQPPSDGPTTLHQAPLTGR